MPYKLAVRPVKFAIEHPNIPLFHQASNNTKCVVQTTLRLFQNKVVATSSQDADGELDEESETRARKKSKTHNEPESTEEPVDATKDSSA